MNTRPFKSLPLGATFRFASETTLSPGSACSRGPWIKLTPRKYMHEDGGEEYAVGSINAEAVEVSPSPLPSSEAEVNAAFNRLKMPPVKRLACFVLAAFLSLPAFAEPCKVNVNSATTEELQLLARTGPALSLRLASERPYKGLEAVDAVKGVGPSWLALNGPHVAFTGPTTCKEKIRAPKVAAQGSKL